MKIEDKTLRVKHMRLLEKFLKSSASILKLENFNYELFKIRANKIYDLIQNLKEIRVDSSYLKSLKNFTELTMKTLNDEELKEDEKRNILLKEVNLIQKNRNKRTYKKQKHKKENHEY
ncbi:MAG: hypothetical protein GXP61_05755 [Epsilonproteobacteria bacterium]|nr:hypothetical protein [Campylobacterota bacterium]